MESAHGQNVFSFLPPCRLNRLPFEKMMPDSQLNILTAQVDWLSREIKCHSLKVLLFIQYPKRPAFLPLVYVIKEKKKAIGSNGQIR
ncbi:hypothetical protein CEXT_807891 [Caerostris extrusa]|uniref:Uncharacterized protein n=1 Tax=Caerostris extrusa TaxID=172846 RepID=A0AAV4YEC3_CAEEX|nr:hypothetical protein CEXT_807891 [Caerostris extrusa]